MKAEGEFSKMVKDIDLHDAILNLESQEDCRNFFKDLCSPAELKAMQERWRVCQILDEDKLSYREINKITGISITTIGRVARFLKNETNYGYRLMLDKIKGKK